MMTFTIITPTVVRETLLRTCRSVDEQQYANWQHVVMVDRPEELVTEDQRGLLARVSHSQREVRFCPQPHRDCGNSCRRDAIDHARGDYVLYIDDDDYYLPWALEEIQRGIAALSPAPVWGVFPILRFGQLFFRIPPGHSSTCNNQFFHQPRAGGQELRYPNAGYCADGEFVEWLRRDFPYACLNPGRPLAVVDQSNLAFSVAMDRGAFEAAFADYITHYSVETEAISLAASYYLLETLHRGHVKRVLDLGTGWSSYVFRFYKKMFAKEMTICSVDESEHWLGMTARFLAKHDLDTSDLRLWPRTGERGYDLVFLDMGRPWERHACVAPALKKAEGMLVCNDLHYEGYRTQLQNTLGAMGLVLTPIPETTDRFGRFMGVAERTPVASA